MPQKIFHPANPVDMDKWAAMPEDKDWYVILHNAVGSISRHRQFKVKDNAGFTKTAHESFPGDPLHAGSCVSAKDFGPGVDLQRLVDLGAIRQATPWEEEEVLRDFSERPGRVIPEGFVTSHPSPEIPVDNDGKIEEKVNASKEAKANQDEPPKEFDKLPANSPAASASNSTSGGFNQPPKGGQGK